MSVGELLQVVCLIIYAVLLAVAAWQDWRTLQIADAFPLTIIAVFALWAVSGLTSGRMSLGEVGLSAAIAMVLLIVGAVAFAMGVLGGGDTKLLAAAGLFAGLQHLVEFLLVVALAGGVLSLFALMGIAVGAPSAGDNGWRRRLPYGPAIAVGGLSVVLARIID